jgi:hypothetical protein
MKIQRRQVREFQEFLVDVFDVVEGEVDPGDVDGVFHEFGGKGEKVVDGGEFVAGETEGGGDELLFDPCEFRLLGVWFRDVGLNGG